MTCEYCNIVQGEGKAVVLYQDDEVVIAVKDMAVTPGQITIFPKQHFPILELTPNNLVERCAILANNVSVAIFESLGAQGTNILVQNGTSAGQTRPHFAVEVIPRREGDGLNLQWQPKQVMEDEMNMVFEQLKEAASKIELEKEVPIESPNKGDKGEKTVMKDDTENYLLKSLLRIP